MGRSTGTPQNGGTRRSSGGSAPMRSASSSSSRSSSGGRGGFSAGRNSGHGSYGSSRSSSSSTYRNANTRRDDGGWAGGPQSYGPRPRRSWAFWGWPRYRGSYSPGYAPSYGSSSGCGCFSLIALIIFVPLFFMLSLAAIPAGCSSSVMGSSATQQQVTHTTTTPKSKLPASDCTPIEYWYEDLAEWIDDPAPLTTGMQDFYQRTGVQPYLIIASSIQGQKEYEVSQVETYLRNRYDELFPNDDGHLILLFCEPYDGVYDPYLLIGQKAQTVIDINSEDIIYTTLDDLYSDASLSNSQYFGKVFSDSAKAIMAQTTTVTTTTTVPTSSPARTSSPIIPGIAAICLAGVIAYFIVKFVRSRKAS